MGMLQQKFIDKKNDHTAVFTDVVNTPNDPWYFAFTADLNRYNETSFGTTHAGPLLKAEFTPCFLKNNRGVLTFEVFDILDKNQGVEHISELNYAITIIRDFS